MGKTNPFNPTAAPAGGRAESPFAAPEPGPAAPPTTAPASERQAIEPVPSSVWAIAGILVLLLLLGLGGYSLYQQKQATAGLLDQLRARDARLDEAEQRVAQRDNALAGATAEAGQLKAALVELKQAKEAAVTAQRDLESEMRAALASKDVAISELQGKLTLSILDRILFDSGQAVIKPEGQEVLRKIAAVLDQFPNRPIQVTGHTDNVPIHTAQFSSNWELSAARALAAVRFMVEEAAVNPTRLAAVAQGEFQPVADNVKPEGRAQNRRIAIVVLPEVFKSPEAAPVAPVETPASATAPPAPGS